MTKIKPVRCEVVVDGRTLLVELRGGARLTVARLTLKRALAMAAATHGDVAEVLSMGWAQVRGVKLVAAYFAMPAAVAA